MLKQIIENTLSEAKLSLGDFGKRNFAYLKLVLDDIKNETPIKVGVNGEEEYVFADTDLIKAFRKDIESGKSYDEIVSHLKIVDKSGNYFSIFKSGEKEFKITDIYKGQYSGYSAFKLRAEDFEKIIAISYNAILLERQGESLPFELAWNNKSQYNISKLEDVHKDLTNEYFLQLSEDLENGLLPDIENMLKSPDIMRVHGRSKTKKVKDNDWSGTDTTPKTDLLCGDRKISVKKKDASQLMSGGMEETLSTFKSIEKYSQAKKILDKISEESTNQIITNMESDIQNTLKKYDVGGINDLKKKEILSDIEQEVMNNITEQKVLQEKFTKLFKKERILKDYFIFEMMTGACKFGIDSDSCANFILTFDETTNKLETYQLFNKISKKDELIEVIISDYVSKVSDNTHFSVSFKSSGKSWGTLRAIFQNKNMKESLNESIDIYYNNLNEIWGENLFKSAVKSLKKGFDFLKKKILSPIKDFLIKNIFNILEPKISLDSKLP